MTSKSILVETIKKKTTPILEKYPVKKAILFGSYAKGSAIITSDIDLYIDTNGELKGLDFVGLLEMLVNALGIDVDLIDRSHICFLQVKIPHFYKTFSSGTGGEF